MYDIIRMACWCTLIYIVGYHNRKVQGHDLSRNHFVTVTRSSKGLLVYSNLLCGLRKVQGH